MKWETIKQRLSSNYFRAGLLALTYKFLTEVVGVQIDIGTWDIAVEFVTYGLILVGIIDGNTEQLVKMEEVRRFYDV